MYQQWVQMEQFYFFIFPLIVVIMVILAIIFLVFVSHLQKSIAKIVVSICAILLVTLGLVGFFLYQNHAPYINQLQYVDASTRNYEKRIFSDFPYGTLEKNAYRSYYNKDVLDHLILYQSQEIVEPVQFMGAVDDGRYGIIINDTKYSVTAKHIRFVPDLKQAQRVGVTFKLKDTTFEKIGFIPLTNKFLVEYRIPESMRTKEVPKDARRDYVADFDMEGNWYLQ